MGGTDGGGGTEQPGLRAWSALRLDGAAATLVLVAAAVLLTDQITKSMALWMSPFSHGALHLVRNEAGTLALAGVRVPLMALLSAAGLATFGRYAAKSVLKGAAGPWFVGLLVGGALSNLVDRLAYGFVRDFLATPWLIVNVADLAVVAGFCGFMLTARRRAR